MFWPILSWERGDGPGLCRALLAATWTEAVGQRTKNIARIAKLPYGQRKALLKVSLLLKERLYIERKGFIVEKVNMEKYLSKLSVLYKLSALSAFSALFALFIEIIKFVNCNLLVGGYLWVQRGYLLVGIDLLGQPKKVFNIWQFCDFLQVSERYIP